MLKAFSITDVGQKRKMNQDYVFASAEPVGRLPNLFIVADGMGGHNAGDFASKFTVDTLVEAIRLSSETNPIKLMRRAIEYANTSLIKKAQEEEALKGMGTTLVAATIVKNYLYVANVGDSRLYVVGEDIKQITKDHSLVEEMVRLGEIKKEDAKNHPDKNIITRAIGAKLNVDIDFFDVKLFEKDIVLICSDGLTNMIEDTDIKLILKIEEELPEKAKKLVDVANENGGKDNIAVVLVEKTED